MSKDFDCCLQAKQGQLDPNVLDATPSSEFGCLSLSMAHFIVTRKRIILWDSTELAHLVIDQQHILCLTLACIYTVSHGSIFLIKAYGG